MELKEYLMQEIEVNPDSERLKNSLMEVETEIDRLSQMKVHSCMFRSKCKWAKEGEKMSAFFFGLEKKKYLTKNINCIIDEKGQIINHQPGIMKELIKFYRELYAHDDNVDFRLKPDSREKRLSEAQKLRCDSPITEDEIFDGLMTLQSNKVPGIDGLPPEWYRTFFKEIKTYLIAMYQFSYDKGLLPESVKKGIISLIPKKHKDTRKIKNMHPLTLLPTSYKILAKTLDNRMREILPSIISESQNGFMAGRNIAVNIRKSLDIIQFCKNKKQAGLILSVDMEKCFNRLSHESMFQSLRYFNFGENFIRWIKLFYTKFEFCVQNYGILSEFRIKEKGQNQGDPISPSIYLLTGEILANKLKLHTGVRGIQVGKIEYLLSQFADDLDMYLPFNQEVVNNVFLTLTDIEKSTGLKVSYEKTTLYRIGSIADSQAKFYTVRKVRWENDYINTLGINIGNRNEDLFYKFRGNIT